MKKEWRGRWQEKEMINKRGWMNHAQTLEEENYKRKEKKKNAWWRVINVRFSILNLV